MVTLEQLVEARETYLAERARHRATCPDGPRCALCTRREERERAYPLTLFQAQLRKMGACANGRTWVGSKTARQAWDTCEDTSLMRWLAYAVVPVAKRGRWWYDFNWAATPARIREIMPFDRLREFSKMSRRVRG